MNSTEYYVMNVIRVCNLDSRSRRSGGSGSGYSNQNIHNAFCGGLRTRRVRGRGNREWTRQGNGFWRNGDDLCSLTGAFLGEYSEGNVSADSKTLSIRYYRWHSQLSPFIGHHRSGNQRYYLIRS